MPDNKEAVGEFNTNPLIALGKWMIQNGKEMTAFSVVLGFSVWAFSDMRDTAQSNRAQAAIDAEASRKQQGEIFKELKDREARAWEMRARDKVESWKHADESNARLDRIAKILEEWARQMDRQKKE